MNNEVQLKIDGQVAYPKLYDSGWLDINDEYVKRYNAFPLGERRVGNTVYLRGLFTTTQELTGFQELLYINNKPTQRQYFTLASSHSESTGKSTMVAIFPTGEIRLHGTDVSNNSWISIDGITYLTDNEVGGGKLRKEVLYYVCT